MKNNTVLASASYLTPLNAFRGVMISIISVLGIYFMVMGVKGIAEGLSEEQQNSTLIMSGIKKLAAAGLCIGLDVILGLMGV